MTIKKRPLFVIEWEDMTAYEIWAFEDETKNARPSVCTAVGWQVPAEKGYIQLTAMRSDMHRCNDRFIIPRKSVKSIRRIE